VSSTDRCDEVAAGLLAAAADVGAHAAVIVMGGMPLALIATGFARCPAGFDHHPENPEIQRGLTYRDPGGSVAGVGAVEAEANAAHHLAHVVLREIGVGATRAARRTVDALFDAAHEGGVIDTRRLWMSLHDVLKCHVLSPY
jgi:hypothetical protein